MTTSAPGAALTLEQREREHSILFAIVADYVIIVLLLTVAVLGGSLTILAEFVRALLMITVEAYSLFVLRKIHRGKIAEFDFGAGKLEQMCNLGIAVSMIFGALWIANGAVRLVVEGHGDASPLGLAFAAALGAINTFVNYFAWLRVRAATRNGARSVIMQAQLNTRFAKLVSSLFIQFTLTVAAVVSDPVIASWADATGALFVSGYIMTTAVGMLREGLPDMLDRSVDEATHLAVLQALTHHYTAYDDFHGVRSRRSGGTVFVEISLGFDGTLSLAEIHERAATIKAHIMREIEGADVSILPLPHAASRQPA